MSTVSGGGGSGAIVRQGHLRKLKTMKKKYFVLRAETSESSARLEYYESEKKFRAGASPRRILPLKSCYNITRRLDLKQKHVIALFTREEQFCIVAENEQDLHLWLAAILKQHGSEDASKELLHPIQHVWQVNVQKKGLGALKNIQGLYNLCLTDKTLALVKIKSHNNVISDLGIPEKVEYSLKNIRRCGDSECFFYMEVGRQTTTGAGELWMLSDDSNIAQSMHSTIYHAMQNCAKETENERDHIVVPKTSTNPLPARRQTYSDGRGRAGLANAENQPPNSLTNDSADNPARVIKHSRTASLPIGYNLFQEPLKISHERTRSAPLAGDEGDVATIEKAVSQSCKAVNGTDLVLKKSQWSRRASTGTRERLSKLSPAHSKNASTLRHRCDSLPTRTSAYEAERAPARHSDFIDGLDMSRDEPDAIGDWHRTPRIPEEPDICDALARDFITQLIRPSVNHSRTTSWCENAVPPGYLPMAPAHSVTSASSGSVCSHTPSADPRTSVMMASNDSVCSGTPSTDPRFREYQLEPATAHISEERSGRAYSVGSRPPPRDSQADGRHRAYSVGAGSRPSRPLPHALPAPLASSPPRAPPASDLMELDFSPRRLPPSSVGRSPPAERHNTDEYVDMSPRTHSSIAAAASLSSAAASAAASGYVEMSYTRAASKPVGDCVDCAGSLPFPLTVEEVLQASIPPPARPASPPAPPLASPPAPPPASPPRPAAPAESLSTVRERETEDADMKTHSEGGSPPPTPTPSGLHYAALALEPRRACRPPVHTPHYTTLQFRHDW